MLAAPARGPVTHFESALLTALVTELASKRERIGRTSRNSSKPLSSDGQGFKSLLKNPAASAKMGQLPS